MLKIAEVLEIELVLVPLEKHRNVGTTEQGQYQDYNYGEKLVSSQQQENQT